MPKVSVIIPVYNVEEYLRQCLDSVVNQTLGDIEIICVDDGSTDGSLAIINEYAAHDGRIKVISHGRTNAGAARNEAMDVALGEYLGFVDADDFCDANLFETAYNQAKDDDADIVSFRFKHYDSSAGRFEAEHFFPKAIVELDRPFSPKSLGDLAMAPLTHGPWARIVRREFVKSEGIRFQEVERMNDVYFCCIATAAAQRLSIVDKALYFYRRGHGGNLQSNNSSNPTNVFLVWSAVADELRSRGVFESFRRSFLSASANSFFYTLGTMKTTDAARRFYEDLRRLYSENALFAPTKADDIAFPQTRGYFLMLKDSSGLTGFLVGQRSYLQDRLIREKWARVALETQSSARYRILKEACDRKQAKIEAQKVKEAEIWSQRCKFMEERDHLLEKIETQKAREAEIWSQRCKFLEERDHLLEKIETQKAREAEIWGQRCELMEERNQLLEKVEAQKVKEAEIWSQRCKFMEERDHLLAKIGRQKAKESEIWSQRCRFFDERNALLRKAAEQKAIIEGIEASVSYRLGCAIASPFHAIGRLFSKGCNQ